MKLETTARMQPCKLTEAFHNYFAVGNLTKCRVHGLDDVPSVSYTHLDVYKRQPVSHCRE